MYLDKFGIFKPKDDKKKQELKTPIRTLTPELLKAMPLFRMNPFLNHLTPKMQQKQQKKKRDALSMQRKKSAEKKQRQLMTNFCFFKNTSIVTKSHALGVHVIRPK